MGALLIRALTWIVPSAVGWVASDVVNTHESRQTNDTIKEVATSAAGAARTNWVKWVMFTVLGTVVGMVVIFIFKFKSKKK